MISRMNAAVSKLEHHNRFILLAVATVIFLRTPGALIHGRIYAEEGTTYLRYAWNARLMEAFLAPHQGYFSLLPNLCTVLAARVFPLAEAGLILVWVSLSIMLLTVWVVLCCEAFNTPRMRMLGALAVVLAAPGNEAWLNTINSQFYLAIAAAVILISDPLRRRALRTSVLLLAGLTGVVSCFLTPFFIVRAIRTRSGWLQASLLSACTLFHVIVLHHIGVRPVQHHMAYFPDSFLIKSVVLPFLSRVPAVLIGRIMLHHLSLALTFAASVTILAFVHLIVRSSHTRGIEVLLLFAMGLWIEAILFYGAIEAGSEIITTSSGGRYAFTCNVLSGLAVILLYGRSNQGNRLHDVSRILVFAFMISGALDYALFWKSLNAGPQWSKEVAQWQSHPDSPLRISPSGWPAMQVPYTHPEQDLPADTYDSVKNGHPVITMK